MKNHPRTVTVTPMAPYTADALSICRGTYNWVTAMRPVRASATTMAPGSAAPGSVVPRGRTTNNVDHNTRKPPNRVR